MESEFRHGGCQITANGLSRYLAPLVALWLLAFFSLPTSVLAQDYEARPVVLEVDGTTQEIWTQAKTVGDVLAEVGVTLNWRDEVILAGEIVQTEMMLPLTQWRDLKNQLPRRIGNRQPQALYLSVKRAVRITLVDGEAIPADIITTADTIARALIAEQVPLYPDDIVFPALDTPLRQGQLVLIRRSTPIAISVDGKLIELRTHQKSVGAALAEAGFNVLGLDQVMPPLDTPLRPQTLITIQRIWEAIEYEEEILPFNTVWRPDDEIPIDQRLVKTAGREGVQKYRYRVRYEDGVEVARTLEDDWVAVKPETKVIAYGQKITPQTLETPEGTITYWRKVRMYATSYSPARSGTPKTAPWYGRTRLGMDLRKGVVAVDPAVVNMQQKLYVPDYGSAIAGDVGGGVKGKHIDLGYNDDDYRSWYWWTDVYLLWPPPAPYAIRYFLPNWPQYPDRGR